MSCKTQEIEEILTHIMMDLTTAVTVLKDYESKPFLHEPENMSKRQCVWRLCVNSIVINCCKYMEVNERYGMYFKEHIHELTDLRNKYYKEINNNKSIKKLRNYCVAHVSNKAEYLTANEVQSEINGMFGGEHADKFFNWLCPDNIESTVLEDSLVGTIQLLRDAIGSKS